MKIKKKQELLIQERLLSQEVLNLFILVMVAEHMQERQMHEILGAMHDKMLAQGNNPAVIEKVLNGFADSVLGLKLAKLEKGKGDASS